MLTIKRLFAIFIYASLLLTIIPPENRVHGQDLVASDSISGGSSVFVFHGSRKQPQARAGGGRVTVGSSGVGHIARVRAGGQISAAAKQRRTTAVAKRPKPATTVDRKATLSNTLTAKADGFADGGQTDSAITNYRAALIQNPKNKRASEGLSNALVSKGIDVAGTNSNEAAVPVFEEAIKYDPQNDVAYAKLGEIHDAKGRTDAAITNYEKALAINPSYTMLYPPLSMLYLDKGDVAKAEFAIGKASAAGIDSTDTRYVKGVLLFKQNKNQEALAAFDGVLQTDPNNADALNFRGQTLERLDKKDEASAAYQKAAAADPNNPTIAFDEGVASYNKGDYANAEIAYKKAIVADPQNYQAHANLASTYRQLERYPEANAEYKLASEGIKTSDLYSEWGFCLGKTAEWDKSVARLNTAKEITPTAIDNNNLGWAYYNAGYTQTAAKNDAAAKESFAQGKPYLQTAVQQDPKLDAAYVNLGATHNALGEYQEAVNALNTANTLHPGWTIALNQLGMGYRGLKDLANAINAFQQVIKLDGNSVSGLFNLGEAFNASGNKKEAKKINDRLKKLDPNLSARLNDIFDGKIPTVAVPTVKVPSIPKPHIPKFP